MISASLQQRKTRTRRSMLFVPGANAAMVSNSFIYPADALMFDLEDSVALREKDTARRMVYHALQHPLYRDIETIVRVNALDSEWGVNDLEAVVRGGADVVRLPKTDTAQDVLDIEKEILRIEKACGREPGSTGLLAAIESPLGITRAVEIAHASERLIGIALGAEDYVRNLRTERSPEGTELLFARCSILQAARSAGIQAFDTVYSDANNEAGFLQEAAHIKQLGFDGKSLINPRQIDLLHNLYAPTQKEVDHARRVVEAAEAAAREGLGVVSLNGKMVMDVIAKMGFKNLTLASSSLSDCHAPLVEHIRQGVVTRIYTSGLRGPLAEEISRGLLAEPVQIHSHGGRVHLVQSGELNIDVAFLGVPSCDEFGNANGYTGKACCGSLGYAMVDADNAKQVVMLTEELLPYPHNPASIEQDQVDLIVKVDRVGDAAKIGAGATRMTTNPRELLIARSAADVIVNSGYFKEGFSMQTGTGGASLAVTRFLEDKMRSRDIRADFALGGITATMVDLHEKGLIRKLLDVQSFDSHAAQSLARNPNHIEISANQYANWGSKGASVDRLDVVVLSALEIDTQFNVNVLTGSDGVLRGASGGHCDTAIASALSIIVAPLVRGRIPTLVDNVLTCITPGSSVDILVTDHGIAVNPARPELAERLQEAGIKVVSIEWLRERARLLTGEPQPIEFTDRVVAVVRYRDGSVIDVVHQVKE